MDGWVVRIGAVAGWIFLIGVLVVLLILPTLIAGQPLSATVDADRIRTYFAHQELAPLIGLFPPFLSVAVVTFGLALREVFRDRPGAHFYATGGLAFLLVTSALYVTQAALAATLITLATTGGEEIVPVFRFYDVLYNNAADVLEGTWILGFSLAMLKSSTFPSWIGWVGVVVAVSRWAKAFAPFTGAFPDAILALLGVFLFVWLGATVIQLTRLARTVAKNQTPTASAVAASG